jgi:hypothetical protein
MSGSLLLLQHSTDTQLMKRKGLFWITILEVLIPDQLTPLLLDEAAS